MTSPYAPPEILAFGEVMTMFIAKDPGELAGVDHFQRRMAVIIKLAHQGSYYRGSLCGKQADFTVPGVPVAGVVDTVGTDDGFAEGVISPLLDGLSPHEAPQRGNLIGALAVQVRGDMEGPPDRIRREQLTSTLK